MTEKIPLVLVRGRATRLEPPVAPTRNPMKGVRRFNFRAKVASLKNGRSIPCESLLEAKATRNLLKELRIQAEWPASGVMSALVCDNGNEFLSNALEGVALDLGVSLKFCPPRQPFFKGVVERYLKGINYQFMHLLPGTTFSKYYLRKEYDSVRDAVIPFRELQNEACIPLTELERLIHIWIVDVYHSRPHAGLRGRTPAAVWAEGARLHPPLLKLSVEAVDVELAEVDDRALGRGGVDINGHRYCNERLCALRRMLPDKSRVKLKHRKSDLGRIHVLDPFSNEYFRVENVRGGFAGMSVEQDEILKQAQRVADPDDSLRVAPAEEIIRSRVNALAQSHSAKDRKQAAKATRQNSSRVRGGATSSSSKRPRVAELSLEVFDEQPELLEEA